MFGTNFLELIHSLNAHRSRPLIHSLNAHKSRPLMVAHDLRVNGLGQCISYNNFCAIILTWLGRYFYRSPKIRDTYSKRHFGHLWVLKRFNKISSVAEWLNMNFRLQVLYFNSLSFS